MRDSGKKDQAFQGLEKSLQDRDWQMTHLRANPILDNLGDDRRFADLVRRVGL